MTTQAIEPTLPRYGESCLDALATSALASLGVPGEPALAGPGALRRASGPDLPAVQAALQPFSIGTPTRLPHSVHEPS